MGFPKLTYTDYQMDPAYWIGTLGLHAPQFADELDQLGYKGICALDFYDDLFGEDLEEHREREEYVTGEYGAIALELSEKDGKRHSHRITVTKGNEELYDLIDESDNFCLMSAVSYAGRARKNDNARFLYAMVIEVDDIQTKKDEDGISTGLHELIYTWQREKMRLPQPTYIVCSGSGLHLYYVFEKPIPLFKNVFKQLSEAKTWLIKWLWVKPITSSYNKIQYEGLCQAFRLVGTKTKYSGSVAMAFKVGEKLTIESLNELLPLKYQINTVYKSDLTKAQAKELYPDWYRRRIENGEPKGTYQRYEGIYHNWIKKIMDPDTGAKVSHRYYCLENLCSLAVQCGISPEQLETDVRIVAAYMEQLTESEDNHFTEYDILSAMNTYELAGEGAYYRKIEYISNKTGIQLTPNKRNGRTQEEHIKRMTALRDVDYPDGSWRKGNGRKEQQMKVYEWQIAHPGGKKADCIRDTKLSKPTVYKWWNTKPVKMQEKPCDDAAQRLYSYYELLIGDKSAIK